MKRLVITLLISISTISSFAQNASAKKFANNLFENFKKNNYQWVKSNLAGINDLKKLFAQISHVATKEEKIQIDKLFTDSMIHELYKTNLNKGERSFNDAYNKVDDWSRVKYSVKDITIENIKDKGRTLPSVQLVRIPFATEKYKYELRIEPIFYSNNKWMLVMSKFRLKKYRIYSDEDKQSRGQYALPKKTISPTDVIMVKGDTTADLVAPAIPEPRAKVVLEPAKKIDRSNLIFEFVEQEATFPGGETALINYFDKNLKYPKIAKDNKIEGITYVQFVVEKDGSLDQVKIKRDIGGGCGAEALRLVKAMPKWIPGRNNGQKVRMYFTLPISFTLEK